MTLQELLAKLRELNPTPADFAKELKSSGQAFFQAIFDLGHGAATAQATKDKAALEAERDKERERANKAEARVARLEEEKPDVAKIREEYQGEITKLTEQISELKEQGSARVVNLLDRRAISDLKTLLVGEYGLDPDYAEIKAERVAARIHHVMDEKNPDTEPQLQVYVEGKQIPIQAEKPLSALAKEIADGTDAKFKVARVDNGSRVRSGGGAAEGTVFERQRKAAEERNEARKSQAGAGSGAERMGIARKQS